MFGTTLDPRIHRAPSRNFALPPAALKRIALAGLDAAWLDDGVKQAWLADWSAEIDDLIAEEFPLPN